MNKEATALLWHQRLLHSGTHTYKNLHKHVDGIPDISGFAFDDLNKCPTCLKVNLSKQPPGDKSLRSRITRPYQGLYVDFAFAGKLAKDKDGKVIEEVRKDVEGINGETAWILISDAMTRMMHGDTRMSKASPVTYLESFLKVYSPDCKDKWVVMDCGGELYNNPAVRTLFKKYGYDVYPTGADTSSQNGPVERAHRTISNGIKSLLIGAGLETKFWPYAFFHCVRLRNAIPGQGQHTSPLELATKRKEDLRNLRTWGCRVWVRPPGKQARRFKDKARKGIFLGYVPHSLRNILWFDVETERVKIATHCLFDEGFNDLPVKDLPPNVQHLLRLNNGERTPIDVKTLEDHDFNFFIYPFTEKKTLTIKIPPTSSAPEDFGLQLSTDELYGRVYVKDIKTTSPTIKAFSNLKAAKRQLRGAFITHVNGEPVFSVAQAKEKLLALSRQAKVHGGGGTTAETTRIHHYLLS